MRLRYPLCFLLLSLVNGNGAGVLHAASEKVQSLLNKPVMLTLTDGRTPRGILSPKTGDSSIVLRSELPDILIESRFSWGIVQAIDQIPTANERSLPRPADPVPIAPSNDLPAVEPAIPPAPVPAEIGALQTFPLQQVTHQVPANQAVDLPPVPLIPDLRRAVVSMTINATVANFNPNSPVDGLLLRVQPLDTFGNVVPVEGNLDIQLVTETRNWSGGQPIRLDDRFQIAERWSVPIQVIGFTPAGIVVKLPFRSFHPERDFDVATEALVNARLRLSSAGVFDASDAVVNLRTSSRFRDDLQQSQLRRLLPFEGPAN